MISSCGFFAAGVPLTGDAGGDLLVVEDVIEPEAEVFGGEGLAIGPAVPLAQVDGQLRLVLAQLVAAGDVGDDALQVSVDGEEFLHELSETSQPQQLGLVVGPASSPP